jgi:phospholipase/carboxylesterase
VWGFTRAPTLPTLAVTMRGLARRAKLAPWVALAVAVACDRGGTTPTPTGEELAHRTAQARASGERPSSEQTQREPALKPAADLVYVELLTGGADEHDRLPLIVALHGLGDSPDSFAGLFSDLKTRTRIALLRAPDPYERGWSWFDFGADDDGGARAGARIRKAADRVARAMRVVVSERPTVGKPVITGFSQGGALSFAIATLHPTLVACALPMGGWLPTPLWPERTLVDRPRIVALHGADDPLITIAPTRNAVEALRQRGYDAELVSFPGVRHAVPAEMRTRLFELVSERCSPRSPDSMRDE